MAYHTLYGDFEKPTIKSHLTYLIAHASNGYARRAGRLSMGSIPKLRFNQKIYRNVREIYQDQSSLIVKGNSINYIYTHLGYK